MARKTTSKKAASKASKTPRSKSTNVTSKSASGSALSHTPPTSRRVVKSSAKTGTVSRTAARSAVKFVSRKPS